MAEYLTSVTIEAKISDVWTDISSYVVTDLVGEGGIYSNAYDNRLASTGSLNFSMNNVSGNFTPSATFKKGTEIKVTVNYLGNSKVKFYGRISNIVVDVGEWGEGEEQRVHVEVLDWMDIAQNQIIRAKEAEANKTIDEAITSLLADIPLQPEATDLDAGENTFPLVFDAAIKNATYYSELNNLILSELGYAYLRDGGQTLKVESASARDTKQITVSLYKTLSDEVGYLLKEDGDYLLLENGDKLILNFANHHSFTASFDNTFEDLEVKEGDNILNNISITVYPRNYDSDPLSTYSLYTYNVYESAPAIQIPFGVTTVLTGTYTEPQAQENGKLPDAAINVEPTFTFTQNSDGTGADYSGNLTTTFVGGGNSWRWTITNNGPVGYLFFIDLAGQPIFRNSPIEVIVEDSDSQNTYGYRELILKQPYKQIIAEGKAYIQSILEEESEPRNIVIKAKFKANASSTNMLGFLLLDLGDLIELQSTKPFVDNIFFIQGWKYKIRLDGEIQYEFILSEPVGRLSPIALRFSGVDLGKNVLHFNPVSTIANLTDMTVSFWVYVRNITDVPLISNFDNTQGWEIWLESGDKLHYADSFTGSFPVWETTNAVMSTNQWVNIIVTYNGSSTTNDPVIYVNNVSQSLTEVTSPSGTRRDNTSAPFNVGNRYFQGDDGQRVFSGSIKFIRIYDRILTSDERADLYANPNDETIVPDFIFTTPKVPTKHLEEYLNNPITPTMFVYDGVARETGTVLYDTSVEDAEVIGEAV